MERQASAVSSRLSGVCGGLELEFLHHRVTETQRKARSETTQLLANAFCCRSLTPRPDCIECVGFQFAGELMRVLRILAYLVCGFVAPGALCVAQAPASTNSGAAVAAPSQPAFDVR